MSGSVEREFKLADEPRETIPGWAVSRGRSTEWRMRAVALQATRITVTIFRECVRLTRVQRTRNMRERTAAKYARNRESLRKLHETSQVGVRSECALQRLIAVGNGRKLSRFGRTTSGGSNLVHDHRDGAGAVYNDADEGMMTHRRSGSTHLPRQLDK